MKILKIITLTASLVFSSLALSNDYISMVVPASPGGTTDLAARLVAAHSHNKYFIENKAGGNGNIAAVQAKSSKPDGRTILMQYSGFHVITPHFGNTQWSQADLTPVAMVLEAPQIITVREDLEANTLHELIAYAKKHPNKLNYGSSGTGSLQHVTGLLLEKTAGIQMVHVPYKGTAPALQDLLSKRIDLTFGTAPPFIPHIQANKIKVLAVTGNRRLESLPDVPTTAELGLKGLNASSWFGVFVPSSTPDHVIAALEKDLEEATSNPDFKKRASDLGATPSFKKNMEFRAIVKNDYKYWKSVLETVQEK